MSQNINTCDGAMWYVETKQTEEEITKEVSMNIYRYNDKDIEPSELGHKYHILAYKEDDANSIEVFNAYLGDVKGFIDNYSKAGFHGMIVKQEATPKKTVKKMFGKILEKWDFPESVINAALQAV